MKKPLRNPTWGFGLLPGRSRSARTFRSSTPTASLPVPRPQRHSSLIDAEELATYRKNQWIPFAPTLARYVITPTLAFTYDLTVRVSRLFGGKEGNYGIAIILLTILVRGIMFPLGRKQALSAQKMQMLQPQLKELQEKYKDDKEKLTREQFALYKRQGVNPVGGCLPALIQLPIFVGLWQAQHQFPPSALRSGFSPVDLE